MQSRSVGVVLALATLTCSPVATAAPGSPDLRLTASQGGLVTERSIATSRGVETTARLSDLTGEDIVLVYSVARSAAARVAEDGRSVALRIEDGRGSLRLGELTVRDASGRDLPARWSIESTGPQDTALRLEIDASDALEPVWIAAALEPVPVSRAKTRTPAERAPASASAAAPSNDTCPGAEIVPGAGPFPWSTATHDVSGATTTGDPPCRHASRRSPGASGFVAPPRRRPSTPSRSAPRHRPPRRSRTLCSPSTRRRMALAAVSRRSRAGATTTRVPGSSRRSGMSGSSGDVPTSSSPIRMAPQHPRSTDRAFN